MNWSSSISCFFIFLYLVFLGNVNIYASNLSIETKTSCCAEESEGCCGIVETRLPITVFSSKSEIEQKVSVQSLRIKPSLNIAGSLVFSYLLPENIGSSKIHFFTHSYRCNDRLAKMSIWRC